MAYAFTKSCNKCEECALDVWNTRLCVGLLWYCKQIKFLILIILSTMNTRLKSENEKDRNLPSSTQVVCHSENWI